MTFLLGLLSIVAVVSAVLLTVVILLQEPKGGGIGAALGGRVGETFGHATGRLNRFTAGLAGVWVWACFLHAVLAG